MPVVLPFLHPTRLRATQLPLPDRDRTPRALLHLALQADPSATKDPDLAGYCALYGLDALPYAQHRQGFLRAGDHRIHVQLFVPQGVVQGTVWLLHGYLEHSALYQPMLAELLQQGFSVLTYDLPGHGLSNGAAASIREFSVYQQILDDVFAWVEQQAETAQWLPKPWLGIGQSTGGAIWMDHSLRRAARRKAPMVSRLLLLSPLVRPAKSAWWHNPLGLSLLSRIKRDVPRAFRRNNNNPDFLRFVRKFDPLQPRAMGMEWILALSRWMPWMEEQPACRVPVWVAQGARDQTVDWRYNHEFIRRKFRVQTVLMLEEGSHQLINERDDIRAPLTALIPVFLHALP